MEPDLIRKFFLRANPNPSREGCPDRELLRGIANNTLPPDHPARLHLASCSPCFAEFRVLKETKSFLAILRRNPSGWGAIAASVALLLGTAFLFRPFENTRNESVSVAPILKTVDLYKTGAFRGVEPSHLAEGPVLPKMFVKLKVILPRFSGPGRYRVGIARDKSGQNVVAEATAGAAADGDREIVTVLLDLRSVPFGVYFLSTTHDDDQASYYYPVTVGSA